MRGKQGYKQTRGRNNRVVFVGIDSDTFDINVNTATPASLNGTNPSTVFSGFQPVSLPQNLPTANLPTLRIANDGNKFALLPFAPDVAGVTPTASQILLSTTTTSWRTRTLPTRVTIDPLKHAWAEVYGRNGRFIVSHSVYPDVVVFDNSNNLTLLQDVFAVNGFQANGIAAGGGVLIAAADDAKVIYQSTDNGLTWTQIAANILVNEFSATPTVKELDRVLALAYGAYGSTNVFFMLAKRNDVSRYRYVLTSPDGVTWTQRLRVDLGTTGTPQEPIIASSPTRTVIVFNNLATATTLVTTTSAATWTQLASTPAANWRAIVYDGAKFVATGEPFDATAAPIVMTLAATSTSWSVKLTGTQKLRCVGVGSTAQAQPDGAVTLFLKMAGADGSNVFIDSSSYPKTITAANVTLAAAQTKWPGLLSAVFAGAGSASYLQIAGNPDIALGLDDFTIEMWVWLNSYSTGAAFWESSPIGTPGQRTNGFVWYLAGDTTVRLFRNGGDIAVSAANVIPLNDWTHMALVRKNGKTTIYVNGETITSTTTSFNDTAAAGGALIGRFCDTAVYGIDGYIGEFRMLKNVALYTTLTFSIPTEPLLNYIPLGAPTNVAAASANRQALLSWFAGWIPNDTIVLGYSVQQSTDSGATWAPATTTAATNVSAVVTNLTNSTSYQFRVAAVTEDGPGPYSAATAATVIGGDVNFQNVLLLLHFDGVNGSTTFTDSSSTSRPVTRFGSTQISTTQSPFGEASAYFNGSSYVSVPAAADFDLSSGDFTIEGWIYNAHSGASGIVGSRNSQVANGWCLYISGNTLRTGSVRGSAGYSDVQLHSTPIAENTWTHFAVVKTSAGYTAYINGVAGSVLSGGGFQYVPGLPVAVGALSSFGEVPFLGYIDDFRITKGVARYTANFTPAPAPFPDDGPLVAPSDLTVIPQNQKITANWVAPRARGFSTIVDYVVQFSADAGTTWTAVTRAPSTSTTQIITDLINGNNYLVRVAAVTTETTGPFVSTTNGVTPSSDPDFANVSLLLRMDGSNGSTTFTDSGPANRVVTGTVNSPTISVAQSKWGGSSGAFGVSVADQAIRYAHNSAFTFGGSDKFVIEMWYYPTSFGTYNHLVAKGDDSSGINREWSVGVTSNTVFFYRWNNADVLHSISATITLNQWTYLAWACDGSTVRIYKDGALLGSTAWAAPSGNGTNRDLWVGKFLQYTGISHYGRGYINDLRITKGSDRGYTGATISVPTAAFPSA